MAKTLRDLALALVNATLILVALCLFLGVQLVSRVGVMADTVTQNLQVVAPLADEVRGTRTELAGLRADLAVLREQSDEEREAALASLHDRISALETRADGLLTRAEAVVQNPADLIDHAIQSTAGATVGVIGQMRGCAPAADQQAMALAPPARPEA
ncbi:MAG: hypothetical protein AAGA05_05640 [Pseudomonadota bacterium]